MNQTTRATAARYRVNAVVVRRLDASDLDRQLRFVADDTDPMMTLVLDVPAGALPPLSGVAYFRAEARCLAVEVRSSCTKTAARWRHALTCEVWR